MSDGRAIVVGGSMAGMLAARVLADHFEQVAIVERDRYPDHPAPDRQPLYCSVRWKKC